MGIRPPRNYRGRIERILNDYTILENEGVDSREVALIAEQFFTKTGLASVDPRNWYTEEEMKEVRQYSESVNEEESFPVTLEQVLPVNLSKGIFSAVVSTKTIKAWLDSQSLYYNPEIQRQPTKEIRRGKVRIRPTVHMKNVREMKALLLKGELMTTSLAFNAAPLTNPDGEELTYDAKTGTLTINEGTRLDILDGYHRCLASQAAQLENPDLNFNFNVIISNLSTREAQQFQAQLARATPIPKARAQELEASRLSDRVVDLLKSDSELRGKISSGRLRPAKGDLVSYSILADAIEREFDMKVRVDAMKVAEFLKEYFDYLIGYNQEEFTYNTNSVKSLMNQDRMFAGYIALAAKMYKKEFLQTK